MKTAKINWNGEFDEDSRKEIYFIVDEKNNKLNLSENLDYDIVEIKEIFNNDLIFVCVDYYTGVELTGIFSYKQNKLIFPFIITDFNTQDKSGYIYLDLDEGLCESEIVNYDLDLNPSKNFAYLNQDGSPLQNEGIIEEKISNHCFILQDKLLSSFMHFYEYSFKFYNRHFDSDDHIEYNNIRNYELSSDKKVLTLEIGEGKDKKTIKIELE